jgi:hypothetical protein
LHAPGVLFSKASKDGSGKATLVTAPNSAVPGVIFEIDLAEREQLDRHEGVGSGYRRNDTFAIALREQSDSRSSSTFRSIGRALATFTVLGLLDPKTESCYGELTVLLGGRRSYAGQARKQV